MILLSIVIFVLLIIIIAMTVIIRRQSNKITFYEEWYIAFKNRVNSAHDAMREVDIRGSFEADDEVGGTFKTIQQIIDDLDKFVQ